MTVKSVALQQVMVEIAGDFVELIFLICGKIISSPTNANVALQLGQAYQRANNLDEAVPALEKAKELGQAENADKLLSQVYVKQAQDANRKDETHGDDVFLARRNP